MQNSEISGPLARNLETRQPEGGAGSLLLCNGRKDGYPLIGKVSIRMGPVIARGQTPSHGNGAREVKGHELARRWTLYQEHRGQRPAGYNA
eukprot:8778196-Pyramimonas_sp.AAC.1